MPRECQRVVVVPSVRYIVPFALYAAGDVEAVRELLRGAVVRVSLGCGGEATPATRRSAAGKRSRPSARTRARATLAWSSTS
jgi:hypothetical protein